jgi:nucleoside-diphosphate-sugar epimerase
VPTPLLREDQATLALLPSHVWDGLRGARLLVTGGTGFVGTWLIAGLAWANRELGIGTHAVVVSRDPEAFMVREPWTRSERWLRFVRGDVREFTRPSGSFSHVIVGAAPADARFAVQAPLTLMETIIQGGSRTLRAAPDARSGLLLSSGAVYGRGGEKLEHIPEEFEGTLDQLDPGYAYHEAKRAMEAMGIAAAAECGLDVKIARLFAFVGPWLPGDRHFAVGNFVRDGLAGRPIAVQGDGSPQRSYLYAADMIAWLLTILVSGVGGRPYNVGSERAVSMSELANLVAAALPVRPPVNVLGLAGSGGGGQRYVPSVERACDELGVRQTVTLEEGVERTIRWLRMREQGAWS